ncbi:head GIN domain-containing protein [Maribacter halichondriae]|uniref:head GIN domain-containing protein n=1 Tax=Maribacter halichondriae TaxID=2980554 RepID=UPI002359CC6B|nr:head GIN domain-containing protein [Maribacter sp. Hal144]
MTTLARIAIAVLVSIFLSSCGFDINIGDFGTGISGNGNVVTEERDITEDFTEVLASEGIQVYVTQADEFEISVEADENVMDLIGTDIRNGKLKIHAIENIGRATKKVYVSLPDVTALKGSSGSHLTTESTIKADILEIDASSGALMSIEINADQVDIEASSGANLTVAGGSDKTYVDASQGANINAKELMAKSCNAGASSGANIRINVSDELTADASSGGNISYTGDANVTTKKSVSGSVHKY